MANGSERPTNSSAAPDPRPTPADRLPAPHLAAVIRLARRLPHDRINWALTGSVAHALQGVDVECHDVDVQTDEHGAYEVEAAFQNDVVSAVVYRESEQIRSHFGRLVFADLALDVEIMGAISKRLGNGTWLPSVDPRDHRVLLDLGGAVVPVLSLAYEAEAYSILGRHERAALLRRATAR